MRYVLDTKVIFAALRSTRGASAAVVRAVREGKGSMLLSTSLLLEYEAICKDEKHLAVSGLTADDVDAEKISALVTADKFERRAASTDLEAFDRIMNRDTPEPDLEADRLDRDRL